MLYGKLYRDRPIYATSARPHSRCHSLRPTLFMESLETYCYWALFLLLMLSLAWQPLFNAYVIPMSLCAEPTTNSLVLAPRQQNKRAHKNQSTMQAHASRYGYSVCSCQPGRFAIAHRHHCGYLARDLYTDGKRTVQEQGKLCGNHQRKKGWSQHL